MMADAPLCYVDGVAGQYSKIDNSTYVLDSTPHILKLAIARRNPSKASRRAFVYHSWRAVIKGQNDPLDEEELKSFRTKCPVDLFLVGEATHIDAIQVALNKPAIVLPYTVFLPNPPFAYQNCTRDFDVIFFCMFSDEQIKRKNVALFLDILRYDRSLRALWIGDYSPYERWAMENAFNALSRTDPFPESWGEPWSEQERSFSSNYGSGILPFGNERSRLEIFLKYDKLAREENLNLLMYRGLSRNQVAHALNRAGAVVVLSARDQWPRASTEALACGVPVVACDHLMSGKQLFTTNNSIIVSPDVQEIARAIHNAKELNRQQISTDFYTNYGLINCSRRVIQEINSLGIDWSDIVDWQRPAEAIFRNETRARMKL